MSSNFSASQNASSSGGEANSVDSHTSTWQSTEGISAYFVLFSTILAFVLLLSNVLHNAPRTVQRYIPEAGMVLGSGMMAGFLVNLLDDPWQQTPNEDDSVAMSLLSFSPKVFFMALLPPIIFNSGYHLRRELFFRHFVPICMFAIVGTFVSTIVIALLLEIVKGFGGYDTSSFNPYFSELLTFGALISATDPVSTLAVFQVKRVDPHLFYLVFGESVLNDAVGLVLFDAFSKFVRPDTGAGMAIVFTGEFIFSFLYDAICSPILGLFFGCASALLFKHADMRSNMIIELSVYMLIMYLPFLLAELVGLSGIVTILFSGMTARSYIVPNLSSKTADSAEILFRLFAHIAETSIFLELGLSVFGMRGSFHGTFILWSLAACVIGRAIHVYPLTFMYNLRLRTEPKTESEVASEEHHQRLHGTNNASHVEMTETVGNLPHHRMQLQKSNGTASSNDGSSSGSSEHGPNNESSVSQAPDTSLTPDDIPETPTVRRDLTISCNTSHMLCFSGLRGAVAYECVRSFPDTFGHQNEFVTTTMVIVLVTVFVLGGTTETALNALQIQTNVDEKKYMEDWHQQRRLPRIILQVEDIIRRNVVREEGDFVSQAPSVTANATTAGSRRRTAVERVASLNHSRDYNTVDVTEGGGHFENMTNAEEMEIQDPAANVSPDTDLKRQRETPSLFDYGSKH